MVRATRSRLRQVIANLVTNSLRHTPHEATITIRAFSPGSRVTVDVADSGPGMTPDEASKAFDRFWRADASRTRSGTGLGLAIVAGIVAAHHGTVTLDSGRDRGTTVTVRLPAARRADARCCSTTVHRGLHAYSSSAPDLQGIARRPPHSGHGPALLVWTPWPLSPYDIHDRLAGILQPAGSQRTPTGDEGKRAPRRLHQHWRRFHAVVCGSIAVIGMGALVAIGSAGPAGAALPGQGGGLTVAAPGAPAFDGDAPDPDVVASGIRLLRVHHWHRTREQHPGARRHLRIDCFRLAFDNRPELRVISPSGRTVVGASRHADFSGRLLLEWALDHVLRRRPEEATLATRASIA